MKWDGNWRGFLEHIEANRDVTELDQWELQMQARVLDRIGPDNLRLVTDGIDPETQQRMNLNPVLGEGNVQTRAQRAIDEFLTANPAAKVAVIPEGPYTMLRVKG